MQFPASDDPDGGFGCLLRHVFRPPPRICSHIVAAVPELRHSAPTSIDPYCFGINAYRYMKFTRTGEPLNRSSAISLDVRLTGSTLVHTDAMYQIACPKTSASRTRFRRHACRDGDGVILLIQLRIARAHAEKYRACFEPDSEDDEGSSRSEVASQYQAIPRDEWACGNSPISVGEEVRFDRVERFEVVVSRVGAADEARREPCRSWMRSAPIFDSGPKSQPRWDLG